MLLKKINITPFYKHLHFVGIQD